MMNPILDHDFNTEEPEEYVLMQVRKGTRFLNYIIDYIAILLFSFIVGIIIAFMVEDVSFLDKPLNNRLLGIACYLTYYISFEYFTKGKTLGKYLTKSRVVTETGEVPTFSTILGRSFSRMVPLEAFSFLGSQPNGWHDRWSRTLVVSEAESVLPMQEADFV